MDILKAKFGKIGQNQCFGQGRVFSQKKWGTNKIEYVCICLGHPWVGGLISIPTFTNYHPPLVKGWCKNI